MSQEFFDFRTEMQYELSIGQTFKRNSRDEVWAIVYLDENNVVLQSKNETYQRGMYRKGKPSMLLEDREYFEAQCGAGDYEIQDEDPDGVHGPLLEIQRRAERLEEQDGRKAKHKAEALREALEVFTEDRREDDREEVDLESLDGIGEKAATNLRHAGYVTKGDFRDASDEELTNVGWVGEKGVESIREATEP
jgi:predicted flap endonuclease-1-like 5' DNA nuclease